MASAFPDLVDRDCYSGEIPEAIDQLPSICELPCDLNSLTALTLSPDQRAVQFPPILPPRDTSRMRRNMCQPIDPPGDVPYTIGGTNFADQVTNLDPMSDNWEREDNAGAPVYLERTFMTRMAWDPDAGRMVAFFRTQEYDSCGNLIRISEEEAYDFTDTGPCSE